MATGNWLSVDSASVENAIKDILREYGDVVFKATEEGLAAGEKVLIKNLKAASPKIKNPPKGYVRKNFAKAWKGTGKKYKLSRYVGNTTTVVSKGKNIPLSNIFEYSTTNHANPFIGRTYESSVSEIASAIVNEIKKEV